MLCEMKKQKSVYTTICSEMSYEELLLHSVGVNKEYVPNLPASTREFIVRDKVDVIGGDIEILFFLDVSSIRSFKQVGDYNTLVPLTIPLLKKYQVTTEQFIKDFNNGGIAVNMLDKNNKLVHIEL